MIFLTSATSRVIFSPSICPPSSPSIPCPSQCVLVWGLTSTDSIATCAPVPSGLWLGLATGRNQQGRTGLGTRQDSPFLPPALHGFSCGCSFCLSCWHELSVPRVIIPPPLQIEGKGWLPAVASPWVPRHPWVVLITLLAPL